MTNGDSRPSKDPIRPAPLRDAGESLRREIEGLLFETAIPWVAVAALTAIIALMEWWRWWTSSPPSPVLLTLLAIAVTGIAAWKLRAVKAATANLKLGLKGERATGQLLQSELLPLGYHVFHDCCFEKFNVDHVAIGPGGVFAIETKTRSKPAGDARVTYDGRQILVNGHAPDRDPVMQAQAGAASVRHVLAEFAGSSVHVRPVVLFPGWFVERQPAAVDTWVLNPKAFVAWVGNEPERLTPEQIRMLAAGLARYVRSHLESR